MSFSIDFGASLDKSKYRPLHKVNLRRRLKKTGISDVHSNNIETPVAPLNGSALELKFEPN
jgi:hypothetical protein